jgi:hypothetical protein
VELQSENFAQSCGIAKNIVIGLSCGRIRLNNSRFPSAPVKSQHDGNEKCTKCPDVAASPHQAKVNRSLYILVVTRSSLWTDWKLRKFVLRADDGQPGT